MPASDQSQSANSTSGRWPLVGVAIVGLALIVWLLLLVIDSSGSGAPSVRDSSEVRDIAEIIVGDVDIDFDPTGNSAVFRLQTSIDVACAVAYGPTAALGSLATDADMAGGGHADHGPVLLGLTPGAEYMYRLQGVGPSGELYQGELMTFTVPVVAASDAASPPSGTNIAVGATVVEVSSQFSDAFRGENAVDGDRSTEWSSRGDGDDAFIVVDLGSPESVIGVGFRTRQMSDGSAITNSFTITVDGGETFGPFTAGPGLAHAAVEFTGRVVRFDVETSTGGNTGAVEVEVYGAP